MSENENLSEKEFSEDDLPNIDYVYGNEDYDPNAPAVQTYADMMESEAGSRIRLEDMNAPRRTASESLKKQMMADDMAMSLGDRPALRDMSEKYAANKNTLDDLIEKKILNRNEKDALKTHLQEEIGSRPEGFSQRRSLEMYHNLMDEQHEKEAQHGLFMLLILAALGVAAAFLEYFLDMNPDRTLSMIYMNYIHFATIVFSILMLIRSKFFKVLSTIYFMVNTVALIGPGLMVYAINPANQEGGESAKFIISLTMFILAIIFSVVIPVRLIRDRSIEAYYAYKKSK